MRLLGVLTVLGIVLAAAPARAGSSSYAVVAIDISGDADPNLRAQVQVGLERGVEASGSKLTGYDEVQRRLESKPALAGCLSTTCLASIAAVVGTEQMIRVSIAANGANYDIELELLGVDGPIRMRTGTCTVCTVSDLADLVATRVGDLLTGGDGTPVALEIVTEPIGATLDIPGVGSQTSPWKGTLAPGTYAIEVRHRGYLGLRQEITVTDDGRDQRFELRLQARPAEAQPRFARLKWIAGGGAAAALVTGVILLGLDGNATCDVGGVTCPEVYDTGSAGALLTLLGVAGAGVAGYMFWSDHRDGHEREAIVVPTAGGAAASLRWTF